MDRFDGLAATEPRFADTGHHVGGRNGHPSPLQRARAKLEAGGLSCAEVMPEVGDALVGYGSRGNPEEHGRCDWCGAEVHRLKREKGIRQEPARFCEEACREFGAAPPVRGVVSCA